ncbi:hypothetical protein [Variovorax sp. dw_954]|uniref:hypothetical protein n=1 Tax=Variovorax sp. dw_954 TaxID=2720078 RepID=UPI001BD4E946|nr:hypothetical protein [Variovorax sp. dw_954]
MPKTTDGLEYLRVIVPNPTSADTTLGAHRMVRKMMVENGFKRPTPRQLNEPSRMVTADSIEQAVITILTNGAVVTALTKVALAFIKARYGRKVKIANRKTGKQVEISGLTAAEVQALLSDARFVQFSELSDPPPPKKTTKAVSAKKVVE